MNNYLQVISGTLRGKKLALPPNSRPTQNKARLAVFNILNSEFGVLHNQFVVWDAFAGSGALGIEAISRFGFHRAIFTDTDPEAIAIIQRNIKEIKDCEIVVKQTDAITYAKQLPNTNSNLLVFVDPPYSNFQAGEKLVQLLSKIVPIGTIIVWEIENQQKDILSAIGYQLSTVSDRTYGRARFLILKKA